MAGRRRDEPAELESWWASPGEASRPTIGSNDVPKPSEPRLEEPWPKPSAEANYRPYTSEKHCTNELLMFRHGLRVSEACQLKVTDVNLKEKIIHIHRLKNGNATTQPMYNGEVGAVNV